VIQRTQRGKREDNRKSVSKTDERRGKGSIRTPTRVKKIGMSPVQTIDGDLQLGVQICELEVKEKRDTSVLIFLFTLPGGTMTSAANGNGKVRD